MSTNITPTDIKKEVLKCDHCGEPCPTVPIAFGEKNFCCHGCQLVYEVIASSGLESYYCVTDTPGTSQKEGVEDGKYAFLDDDEIKSKLLDFSDGKIGKVTFYLPQIHCASCIWLLEKIHLLNHGITHARTNFLRKEVNITFKPAEISLREIAELLSKVGYAPLISLNDLEEEKAKPFTQTSGFFLRLGITGFCFGNIMLLSFPEYLGLKSNDMWGQVFGYLNILLSLPVFFYGASPYWRSALAAIKHRALNVDVPISLGMIALFGRSIYEILSHTGAGYLDSLASLVFLLLAGRWFQQTTFNQISFERDYRSYFPIAVLVKKGEKEKSTPLSNLQKNDAIVLRHGELVPADSILVKGEAFIDYSFVTGESEPVYLKAGEKIFAGGRQQGGRIELVLEKEVSQSYLTRLWYEQAFQREDTVALGDLTSKISQYFTFAIIAIATVAAGYWWLNSPAVAINVFTAVLIIACPCALALNVPFTLGNALRILARFGFYLKETHVIEKIAKLTQIVFDKTGTLTEGGEFAQSRYEGEELSGNEKAAIYSLVSESTHPISKTIEAALNSFEKLLVTDFQEILGSGIQGNVNGSLIKIGKHDFVSKEKNIKQDKISFQSATYISINHKIKGAFYTQQNMRKGLKSLLNQLRKHYVISLLSGDYEGERKRLASVFNEGEKMLFRQLPAQKMAFINQLQNQGEKVAMIGDGLNDAGALKQSDVGIAISNNVNQFSPACDAILNAKQFYQADKLLQFSRRCVRIVYGGFTLSLLYNIVGLTFAVQGLLSPLVAAILMPVSSITVVLLGVLGTWVASGSLNNPHKGS